MDPPGVRFPLNADAFCPFTLLALGRRTLTYSDSHPLKKFISLDLGPLACSATSSQTHFLSVSLLYYTTETNIESDVIASHRFSSLLSSLALHLHHLYLDVIRNHHFHMISRHVHLHKILARSFEIRSKLGNVAHGRLRADAPEFASESRSTAADALTSFIQTRI
jgi:hypothetical protein